MIISGVLRLLETPFQSYPPDKHFFDSIDQSENHRFGFTELLSESHLVYHFLQIEKKSSYSPIKINFILFFNVLKMVVQKINLHKSFFILLLTSLGKKWFKKIGSV